MTSKHIMSVLHKASAAVTTGLCFLEGSKQNIAENKILFGNLHILHYDHEDYFLIKVLSTFSAHKLKGTVRKTTRVISLNLLKTTLNAAQFTDEQTACPTRQTLLKCNSMHVSIGKTTNICNVEKLINLCCSTGSMKFSCTLSVYLISSTRGPRPRLEFNCDP